MALREKITPDQISPRMLTAAMMATNIITGILPPLAAKQNYVVGVNAVEDGVELKEIFASTGIAVTHSAGRITITATGGVAPAAHGSTHPYGGVDPIPLANGKIFIGNFLGYMEGRTVSGDATLTNAGVMTLASSGVIAGTYGTASALSSFTVDAKGRITGASSIALNTSNIVEGTNLYYTQGRFDTAFAAKSTTNLSEGTNLYYTDARARAAFSGTANQIIYNSATGNFSTPQNIHTGASPTFAGITATGSINAGTLLTAPPSASGSIQGLRIGSANSYQAGYLQSSFDTQASFLIGHNMYVDSNGSGVASYKWAQTHGNFGSRGIEFSFNTGIKFYFDNAAATGGASFTPTTRMILQSGLTVGSTYGTGSGNVYVGKLYQGTTQVMDASRNFSMSMLTASGANFSGDIRFPTFDGYIYSFNGGISGQVRSGIQLDGTNQVLKLFTSNAQRVTIASNGDTTFTTVINVSGKYVYGDTTNQYVRLDSSAGTYLAYSTNRVYITSADIQLQSLGTTRLTAHSTGVTIVGNISESGNFEQTSATGRIYNNYVSGIIGTGFDISRTANGTFLEIDNITVRNALRTHIFQKDVVKVANGYLYISDSGVVSGSASGQIKFKASKSASFTSGTQLWIKDANENTGTITSIKVTLTNSGTTVGDETTYTCTYNEGLYTDLQDGMTAARISGGTILFDSSSTYSPFMDVAVDGVTKLRVGRLDGIASMSGYGIWASNGTDRVFYISTNGSAEIASWKISPKGIYSNAGGGAAYLYIAKDPTLVAGAANSVKPTIVLYSGSSSGLMQTFGQTYTGVWNTRYGVALHKSGLGTLFEISGEDSSNSFTAKIAGWNFDNAKITNDVNGDSSAFIYISSTTNPGYTKLAYGKGFTFGIDKGVDSYSIFVGQVPIGANGASNYDFGTGITERYGLWFGRYNCGTNPYFEVSVKNDTGSASDFINAKIAGWNFDNTKLWNATGTLDGTAYTTTGMVIGSTGYIAAPKFRVTTAGVLYAVDVNITGTINATAGQIGGSVITSTTITGGIIQTSSSSSTSRVVIDTNGIHQFYGSDRWLEMNFLGVDYTELLNSTSINASAIKLEGSSILYKDTDISRVIRMLAASDSSDTASLWAPLVIYRNNSTHTLKRTGDVYGVFVDVNNDPTTAGANKSHYGIYSKITTKISGSGKSIAVYGSAIISGGGKAYAGYFADGDVLVQNVLFLGTEVTITGFGVQSGSNKCGRFLGNLDNTVDNVPTDITGMLSGDMCVWKNSGVYKGVFLYDGSTWRQLA